MGQYEGDEKDGDRISLFIAQQSAVPQPSSGAQRSEPHKALHPNQLILRGAERVVLAVTTFPTQKVTSC